ncbi:MAG: SDR family oxidoreductase [Bacteroidales bacterium]|nr:SDR family oxidoreductase [Bacteroidales bacterium]
MMIRKQALITGAASGLGLEFCRLLAAESYALVMVDKDGGRLEHAAQSIRESHGAETRAVVLDLGEYRAAERLFGMVDQLEFDVLINSAGFGLFGFFAETDWSVEESMLQLHILNLTHLTKLIVQKMIARGSGRIMNISSLAAFQPGPLMNIYYASKSYIHFFSEALANEVKGTGVSVTVLLPGLFNTNFASTAARVSGSPEKKEKIVTTTVDQVARAALRGMMKGRIRVIPGFSNKLLALAPRILPRNLMLVALRKIQEGIRKKEAV